MEPSELIFQVDSEVVRNAYSQLTNYLIEYSECNDVSENFCIIYFSSNEIYYPNNEQTFRSQVLDKNKFEWYRTRIQKGKKHIFLRDIIKQWYLTGINNKISTIEKLADFLKKETEGYKVITIGSSAGGFAAVLFGSMLNAETIYTFNGQFLLSDLLSSSAKKYSSEKIDPIIYREQHNPKINKYYSLRPYIQDPKRIYYLYSDRSPWDLVQFNHVSDLNIRFIPFRTSHHGIPFLKTNLAVILNMTSDQLNPFVAKINNPILFSIRIDGLFKTTKDFMEIVYNYFFRKFFGQ